MSDNSEYIEKKIMPFGKYSGEYVMDLPQDYLEWLIDNTDIKGELLEAVELALYENYGV